MNIIVDSTFKPFSYQEMLAPVLAETQAHQNMEQQYATLAEQASVWEKLANSEMDKEQYEIYQNYMQDLMNAADSLSQYGLPRGSKRDLYNMRARYKQQIYPIEEADKKRNAIAQNQYTLLAQHPEMRFEKDASDLSLSDLIKNPNYIPKALDGNSIYTKAKEQGAALSSRVDPQFLQLLQDRTQFYKREGFNEEAAQLAMQDIQKENPELYAEVADVIKSFPTMYGYKGWKDEEGLNGFAQAGLLAGLVGKTGEPTRNLSVLSAKEAADNEMARQRLASDNYWKRVAANQNQQEIDLKKTQLNYLMSQNDPSNNVGTPEGIGTYDQYPLMRENHNAPKEIKSIVDGVGGKYNERDGSVTLPDEVTVSSPRGYRTMTTTAGTPITYVTGSSTAVTNKEGGNKFKLFNDKGQLMSKDMFMFQGKTTADQKILGEYFDRFVDNVKKTGLINSKHPSLNAHTGKRITKYEIQQGFTDYINRGGASYINTIPIPVSDPKKTFTNHVMGNKVYKIKGNDIAGYRSSKPINFKDVLKDNKDGNFRYNLSIEDDKQGLIIYDPIAESNYFMPKSEFHADAQMAMTALSGGRYTANKIQSMLDTAYKTGTINAVEYNQATQKVRGGLSLNNSAALKSIIRSQFGNYVNYDTSINNQQ